MEKISKSYNNDKSVPASLSIEQLSTEIDKCLLRDRKGFRHLLDRIARSIHCDSQLLELAADKSTLETLLKAIDASRAVVSSRERAHEYICDPSLPFSASVKEIKTTISNNQIVLISGSTGSGKSTQIPQLLLSMGRGVYGRIGHTQPRRIAARSISKRISDEMCVALGSVVGYSVRFEDNIVDSTKIKVMTDGVLLNEVQRDSDLTQYDTIILDEVHERSLNLDLLIGYLSELLPRRPDLKLILASASMNEEFFRAVFKESASCIIEGMVHPVETFYFPIEKKEKSIKIKKTKVPAKNRSKDLSELNFSNSVWNAIKYLDQRDIEKGDILVFLPGEKEITDVREYLVRKEGKRAEILVLYGRLPSHQQNKVFRAGIRRRIILATNVAETSLTVPNVAHVIDTGLARVSRYSVRRKIQQLPVEKISRDKADQRRGRCGRERPGICLRLYSENDYVKRPIETEPEIFRTNLADVILRVLSMGYTSVNSFPFPENPSRRLIRDGLNILWEIGAVDEKQRITPAGHQIRKFPIDPRLARVLLEASDRGCLKEILIIVSALSINDPRERSRTFREYADREHRKYNDNRSDLLWFLRAWHRVCGICKLTPSKMRRVARKEFLSDSRIKEWVLMEEHLRRICLENGLSLNEQPATYKNIHVAIAAGFPSSLARRNQDWYIGCRDSVFTLHRNSILKKRKANWVLALDIVETENSYARVAARVDPQWFVEVAPLLVKKTYDTSHWDDRRGQAFMIETQRLLGLVVSDNKKVELKKIDPLQARRLLIEKGLIDGRIGRPFHFLARNQRVIRKVKELEEKTRRRDLLASREQLREFYEKHLPSNVMCRKSLTRWLKTSLKNNGLLFMTERDASAFDLSNIPTFLFPPFMSIEGTQCRVKYTFAPEDSKDGVSVVVPLVLASRLRESNFDKLVPGLLSEKVESLLRSLPKTRRRMISPLKEYTLAALESVSESSTPLKESLACALKSMTGVDFSPEEFRNELIGKHLHCYLEIVDHSGKIVLEGRVFEVLPALRELKLPMFPEPRTIYPTSGEWQFEKLPEQAIVKYGAFDIVVYPGLVRTRDGATAELFISKDQANRAHIKALERLLVLGCEREIRHLRRLEGQEKSFLLMAFFGFSKSLTEHLVKALASQHLEEAENIRNEESFQHLLSNVRGDVTKNARQMLVTSLGLLEEAKHIHDKIEERHEDIPALSLRDLRKQLRELMDVRFVYAVVEKQSLSYERYFAGILVRLDRIRSNPGKDGEKLNQYLLLRDELLKVDISRLANSQNLRYIQSLFEEWRIALFAPELGTAMKITSSKIKEALSNL